MIYCVCPFSRPNNLKNVLDNFSRQKYADKKLIVVKNGDAISSNIPVHDDIIVLSSEAHQSHAKNIGLQYLKDIDGEYFSTLDDDDYYGPNYLSELSVAFKAGHNIVGKSEAFLKLTTDDLFLINSGQSFKSFNEIHGPTISFKVFPDTHEFPIVPFAEDNQWVQAAISDSRYGAPYCTSRYNFCYNRVGGQKHTFPPTDSQLIYGLRVGLYPLFYCGKNSNDIVNGVTDPEMRLISKIPDGEIDISKMFVPENIRQFEMIYMR